MYFRRSRSVGRRIGFGQIERGSDFWAPPELETRICSKSYATPSGDNPNYTSSIKVAVLIVAVLAVSVSIAAVLMVLIAVSIVAVLTAAVLMVAVPGNNTVAGVIIQSHATATDVDALGIETLTCSHVEHCSAQGAANPHVRLGVLLHPLLHVLRLPFTKENLNSAVNLEHSRTGKNKNKKHDERWVVDEHTRSSVAAHNVRGRYVSTGIRLDCNVLYTTLSGNVCTVWIFI